MRETVIFLGGTSGLGKLVADSLSQQDEIIRIGKKELDFSQPFHDLSYTIENWEPKRVVIFTNYNYDCVLHKYPLADNFDKLNNQIQVNITAVTQVVCKLLHYMRLNGGGKIILASSILTSRVMAGTGIYSACKAYYESLVKTAAQENASSNITINCIQMGYMDGGLTHRIDKEILEKIQRTIPAKRFGDAYEAAALIDHIFDNDYINGATIKIAGGL